MRVLAHSVILASREWPGGETARPVSIANTFREYRPFGFIPDD